MPSSRRAYLLSLTSLLFSDFSLARAPSPPNPAPEDWSTPALKKGQLTPLKPLVGQEDDFPQFTRELVEVQWRAGDPIYLSVMLPKLVRKPPVILYLYTYDTSMDRFLHEKFVNELVKGGYAAVGFTAALDGTRYHDRPMKQWFISELQESLATTTHDVQMILDYLESRGDVDVEHAGMLGEGSGGAVAVLAASADSRLKAIDLLNPWGDWPDWLAQSPIVPADERANYTTPAFLAKVANLDPVRWLPHLQAAVRLEYMGPDTATPQVARDAITASVPKQTLVVPSGKALADYTATRGAHFLDWIKQKLSPSPAEPSHSGSVQGQKDFSALGW